MSGYLKHSDTLTLSILKSPNVSNEYSTASSRIQKNVSEKAEIAHSAHSLTLNYNLSLLLFSYSKKHSTQIERVSNPE
jgi:hypothetical protein